MKVERVPLAVDAEVRYALGPLQLPLRALVLMSMAFVPAVWCLGIPGLSGTWRLVFPVLVMSGAAAIAAPKVEGIWIGTFWVHRALGRWTPTLVDGGRAAYADVAVLSGGGTRVGTRGATVVTRWLGGRWGGPARARRIEDGLFELHPGGWRAILSIQAPPAATSGDDYAGWVEAVVGWLTSVGVPAQFCAVAEHQDGVAVARQFDAAHQGEAGSLRDRERALLGSLAARTLGVRNYVVLCPGLAGPDGMPVRSGLGGTGPVPGASRDLAERALQSALRLVNNHAIRAAACPAASIRGVLAGGPLLARSVVRTTDMLLLGTDHCASICVTSLPPVVQAGAVVAAMLRSNLRGAVTLYIAPVSAGVARKKVNIMRQTYQHVANGSGDIAARVMLGDVEGLAADLAARERTAHVVALTLTVRAVDRPGCEEQVARVLGSLEGDGLRPVRCTVPGFEPYVAGTPGGAPMRRSLLLTTNGVAACLLPALGTPFGRSDEPLVGVNVNTGTPSHLSVFTGRKNMNLLCVGTSGAGKSVTMKTLLYRHVAAGARALVIDPDSEYRPVMEAIGGAYIELGRHAVNAMHADAAMSPDDAAACVVPALSVMGGNEVGISVDGHPIRRLPEEDQGWLHGEVADFFDRWRRCRGAAEPVISDLLDFMDVVSSHRVQGDAARERCRVITFRLRTFTQGARGRVFNQPTSFHPGAGSFAVGLRELALQYRADLTPALAIILGTVLGELPRRRGPMIVLVDEAHHVTGDPDAGQVLARLVRQARKYGAGVWMASQQVEDFLAADGLGRTLAATAATKVILGLEASMADEARSAFKLTVEETRGLVDDCPPGRAVVLSGDERAVVDVLPGEHLLELVNTTSGAWAA